MNTAKMATLFKKRKKFGEIAVAKGVVSKAELEQALTEQKESRSRGLVHKKIGAILLEKGFIEIDDVSSILGEQQKSTFWSRIGLFFSLRRGV